MIWNRFFQLLETWSMINKDNIWKTKGWKLVLLLVQTEFSFWKVLEVHSKVTISVLGVYVMDMLLEACQQYSKCWCFLSIVESHACSCGVRWCPGAVKERLCLDSCGKVDAYVAIVLKIYRRLCCELLPINASGKWIGKRQAFYPIIFHTICFIFKDN